LPTLPRRQFSLFPFFFFFSLSFFPTKSAKELAWLAMKGEVK